MTDQSELVTRAYTNLEGKRTTMRLDKSTWAAVDQLAGATNITWHEWLNHLSRENVRRVTDVRRAVVDELMNQRMVLEAQLSGRPLTLDSGALLTTDIQLMEAVPLNDTELREDLTFKTPNTIVSRTRLNLQGFSIRTGRRKGRPYYWIVNGMRGGHHLALPAPDIQFPASLDVDVAADGGQP